MQLQGVNRTSNRDVQNFNVSVLTASQQVLSVRMEGDGVDGALVNFVDLRQRVGPQIINPHFTVRHGSCYDLLGVPSQLRPVSFVVLEGVLAGPSFDVKDPSGLILGARRELIVIWTEASAPHKVPVLTEGPKKLFVAQPPQFNGLIVGSGEKVIAGRVQVDRAHRGSVCLEKGRRACYFRSPKTHSTIGGSRSEQFSIFGPAHIVYLSLVAVELDGTEWLLVLERAISSVVKISNRRIEREENNLLARPLTFCQHCTILIVHLLDWDCMPVQ